MYCREGLFLIIFSIAVAIVEPFQVVSTTSNPSSINTNNSSQPIELKITLFQDQVKQSEGNTLPDIPLLPLHLLASYPKDCEVYKERGAQINGLYRIQPDPSSDSFLVLCDMSTRGGGWTYLLNRYDGSQNFDLLWSDYRDGFGNLNGEFWLGLEKMHALTESTQVSEILIELVDWDNKKVYAHYSSFKVGSEDSGYELKVNEYSGNAGDSFQHHNGQKFSTKERDQDKHSSLNCAERFKAGWWYLACFTCNLNGKYIKGNTSLSDGIHWARFHPDTYSLKQARMMVRSRELWK